MIITKIAQTSITQNETILTHALCEKIDHQERNLTQKWGVAGSVESKCETCVIYALKNSPSKP